MGRLRRSAPVSSLALLFLALNGCGGGSYSIQPPPPPPPQPDFSIGFSQNSISVLQGATSQAVNLSVNPLNGFTGSVQVTLSGLPSGVVSSPASPFSIPAGSTTPVLIFRRANRSGGKLHHQRPRHQRLSFASGKSRSHDSNRRGCQSPANHLRANGFCAGHG
jgi:hypothetical protein